MTSPVAVVGLTYRTTDLQPADLHFFLDIFIGLNELPEVRGQDTIIPDQVGLQPRNRKATRRYIELRGFVRGAGADEAAQRGDFRDTMDALQALFDNTLQPDELVAVCEDGTTRTIDARSLSILMGTEPLPSYRSLSIALESLDPNWVVSGS
jgi:hypothetical protein